VKSLREWRTQRLWSVRDLAGAAGVSTKTVVQIEHSRQLPTFRTMRRICGALEIEPAEVTEFAEALGKDAA